MKGTKNVKMADLMGLTCHLLFFFTYSTIILRLMSLTIVPEQYCMDIQSTGFSMQ